MSLAQAYAYSLKKGRGAYGESEDYLKQAAKAGDSYAQYKVGMLFLNHTETAESTELARAYLSLAAEKGNLLAKSALTHLEAMPKAKAQALVDSQSPAPRT